MTDWLILAEMLAARSRSWDAGGWLVFGGILGVVLLGVLYAHYREKKRTRDLETAAREQGFDFSPGHDALLMDELLAFQLFSQGSGKKTRNVLTGQVEDSDFVIFDYQYTTGSGKHRTTHYQTVLLIRRPGWNLPQFYLRPESVFSKIGKVFGYTDIDFETRPEFSRRYNLSGPSQVALRRLFTDALLDFYESNPGLCTEASEHRVIVYRAGTRLAPAQIAAFYALGWSLHQALPAPTAPQAIEDES